MPDKVSSAGLCAHHSERHAAWACAPLMRRQCQARAVHRKPARLRFWSGGASHAEVAYELPHWALKTTRGFQEVFDDVGSPAKGCRHSLAKPAVAARFGRCRRTMLIPETWRK